MKTHGLQLCGFGRVCSCLRMCLCMLQVSECVCGCVCVPLSVKDVRSCISDCYTYKPIISLQIQAMKENRLPKITGT